MGWFETDCRLVITNNPRSFERQQVVPPSPKVERCVEELRIDDDLMATVTRSKKIGCDRANRGFDWLCLASSGLCGRIIGERGRLVAAVPLLNEIRNDQISYVGSAEVR